jgi:hypothetical protein
VDKPGVISAHYPAGFLFISGLIIGDKWQTFATPTGTAIFVASDAAAGGDGSKAKPFATVALAVAAAANKPKATILLRAGTYSFNILSAASACFMGTSGAFADDMMMEMDRRPLLWRVAPHHRTRRPHRPVKSQAILALPMVCGPIKLPLHFWGSILDSLLVIARNFQGEHAILSGGVPIAATKADWKPYLLQGRFVPYQSFSLPPIAFLGLVVI